MMRNLENVRQEINKIDEELEILITKRMELSNEVARNKIASGGKVFVPERETEILEKISGKAPQDVSEGYKNIWKSIMRTSRKRQYDSMIENGIHWDLGGVLEQGNKALPVLFERVAFCGNEGSYSWSAARRMYPDSELVGYATFDKACKAVDDGECSCVVLPVDNSTAGIVLQVYNLIIKYDFKILSKSEIMVDHVLAAKNDIDIDAVKKVYSHQQALMQCSEFLNELNVETNEMENTAFAARYVKESDEEGIAAIASVDAAEMFGLKIIKKHIINSGMNCTRFISLSKSNYISKNADLISTEFSVKHQSGALANVLEIVASYGLNVSKIQSIPSDDKAWEYVFFMDVECDVSTQFDLGKTLMLQLDKELEYFRYLGWY